MRLQWSENLNGRSNFQTINFQIFFYIIFKLAELIFTANTKEKKMKKRKILLSVFLIAGLISGLLGIKTIFSAPPQVKARKIVVFNEDVGEEVQKNLLKKFDAEDLKNLKLINGRAAVLSEKAVKNLSQSPEIKRIDDDIIVYALEKLSELGKKPKGSATQPSETLPWGIDRIDADLVWGVTTGDTVKVAVIDTGIDLAHPDLKNNIKGGYNAINSRRSANDDNGHGTHVAGIIGAIDNEIGVIGVGPKINLYAVKVLNRNGSGYLSDIIEGLDWCIDNGMQVVNMSLGTSSYVESFEDAVKRVEAAGIVQVAAAGNSGPYDDTVNYPAKFPEVIAVSAIDKTDTITSWSSRGPEVDLAAPGVSIYSTYKGSSYKILSGTSMASPHVAGAAALVLDVNSGYTSEQVKQKLLKTADDLGAPGPDNLYGAGLVDAEEAVTGIETE
ncbi:MAG: aerolysin [Parcubacteria group bacterium Athens1014_10]|nr:MAG: aerolysin [Parcubacteria group bacterium Athens1014_10]TSD05184.1 MAG: aerolysin [Parcubacteria group bacterium Athens0714_12]